MSPISRPKKELLSARWRIERQTASRVGVAGDQEIYAQRRVGVGARLDVLRMRGGYNRARCPQAGACHHCFRRDQTSVQIALRRGEEILAWRQLGRRE
jgi:hypothetical protein